MCDLPFACGNGFSLYVDCGISILFCDTHLINVVVIIYFLLVVVNLTLVDLPGLTKVAVGTLSYHYLFTNNLVYQIINFFFPIFYVTNLF
jgi:hypothetical protein